MPTAVLKKPSKHSEARPRWATPRTDRPTYGHRPAAIAAVLGTPLYPWQRQVADVGLEYDPATGLLAYQKIIYTVPRQAGKSTLSWCWELDRSISPEWGQPQRTAYSAQTGWDARRKLIDDQVPVLEESKLWPFVRRVLRGQGNESVIFKTRGRIDIVSGDKGAGHGRTLDLGVIDEAFDDVDDRREGALVPAMKTRRNSQLLVTSTAGTDESIYLKRLVRAGRSAVEKGVTQNVAYFEWSVPQEEPFDDPEVWRRYVPALTPTAEAAMSAAVQSDMSESEFRRAFLNQWTTMETDRVIPVEAWDAVTFRDAKPEAPLRLGLDVMPDRSSGAIVVVGQATGELVETFEGMGRVVTRAAELSKRHKAPIVIDGTGPAASIADELEAQRVKVERLSGPDYAASCARIFDAIMDRQIAVRSSNQLDVAVAGVRKRPQGDRFVWARTSSATDVTPFIALTLAFGAPPTRKSTPLVATT